MYKNSEGYRDPTAGEAIRAADRSPKHIDECRKALNEAARKSGLVVIALKDIRTGRKWFFK